jgi:hypothetical protein
MKINESYLLLFVLIVITLAYGYYYKSNFTENFNVLTSSGKRRLGSNLNAKQCQDLCEQTKNCKYVIRPKGKKPWERTSCEISNDFYQHSIGKKDSGQQIWENTKYVQPEKPRYVRTIGGYSYTRNGAAKKCKDAGLELCHSKELINHKGRRENVCSSGWTKDRRGWWVGRWRGWGCGGHWRKYWNWWGPSNRRSSAHCCTKYS